MMGMYRTKAPQPPETRGVEVLTAPKHLNPLQGRLMGCYFPKIRAEPLSDCRETCHGDLQFPGPRAIVGLVRHHILTR